MQSHGLIKDEITNDGATENKKPEIYNRFEIKSRHTTIYAIKSEDHYLRFYTSGGEFLILMRLYDAIKELEGIEGTQCHRSWWIAKDAIIEIENINGKKFFVIPQDVKIPISRTYQNSLKELEWI